MTLVLFFRSRVIYSLHADRRISKFPGRRLLDNPAPLSYNI